MASRSAASVPVIGGWMLTVLPDGQEQTGTGSSPDSVHSAEAKVPGQLGVVRVVEPDVAGAEVLGQVDAGAGAGDEQDVGGEVQQPGERDLHRRRAQPRGRRSQHGVGEKPAAY